ncbi:hypothetical protein PR048_009274 [Dryococelus australis]|uniref:Uncharacterized protein n=1 Tax=Dryococelus australis TaxID=614101 RepID=A0ABQ9HZF1_9NEOP|nr:hypothetical protein PR048_009274 [Dryococelus australis]
MAFRAHNLALCTVHDFEKSVDDNIKKGILRRRRNDDEGFGLDTRFGGSSAAEYECMSTAYNLIQASMGEMNKCADVCWALYTYTIPGARGKREISEKTRRPAASSRHDSQLRKSWVTLPGIEPGLLWLEASINLGSLQWRVVKCCKVSWCLPTAVHCRCTQQKPIITAEPRAKLNVFLPITTSKQGTHYTCPVALPAELRFSGDFGKSGARMLDRSTGDREAAILILGEADQRPRVGAGRLVRTHVTNRHWRQPVSDDEGRGSMVIEVKGKVKLPHSGVKFAYMVVENPIHGGENYLTTRASLQHSQQLSGETGGRKNPLTRFYSLTLSRCRRGVVDSASAYRFMSTTVRAHPPISVQDFSVEVSGLYSDLGIRAVPFTWREADDFGEFTAGVVEVQPPCETQTSPGPRRIQTVS